MIEILGVGNGRAFRLAGSLLGGSREVGHAEGSRREKVRVSFSACLLEVRLGIWVGQRVVIPRIVSGLLMSVSEGQIEVAGLLWVCGRPKHGLLGHQPGRGKTSGAVRH